MKKITNLTIVLIVLMAQSLTASYTFSGENTSSTVVETEKQEISIRYKRVVEVLTNSKTNLTNSEIKDVARLIAEQSYKANFSVEFILAVIKTESSFNKMAHSNKGAMGLMQLMPATGRAIAKDLGIYIKDSKRFYNPQLNVVLGIAYLKKLSKRYKDMNLVLAAYNMGPTNFRKYGKDGSYPVFKYTKLVNKNHVLINEI